MNALTNRDIQDLERIESEIEQDQHSFFRLARNLAEIKDRRLYLKDYKTFEAYCQTRWGWSRAWVYQQINSAQAVHQLSDKSVSTMVDKVKSDGGAGISERQARAISEIPVKRRETAIEHAASKPEPLTARSISESAKAVSTMVDTRKSNGAHTRPVPIQRDATGWPIPDARLELFRRGELVKRNLEKLADIRGTLRRVMEAKLPDPLYAECQPQEMLMQCDDLYASIKRAVPYAVCPTCQGIESQSCMACKKRGVVSEFFWKTCVPQELKDIRAKALEDERK